MSEPGPLVIVGDTLLDVDLEGRSERLSPDASVPVVDLDRQRVRPGGAGLTALLAARAGVPVVLITALGHDDSGELLAELLGDQLDLIVEPLRGSTVVKTRVRSDDTALARLDTGDGIAGGCPLSVRASTALRTAGGIVVADYGRGMAWQHEIRGLLAARPSCVPLVWDPHPRGARPVAGATLITPNEAEADRITPSAPDALARGRELCERWEAIAVAVTLGERGAMLTEGATVTERLRVPEGLAPTAGKATTQLSTGASSSDEPEIDACGAGDRFAGAAGEALRSGQCVRDAVQTAIVEATRFVRAGGPRICSTELASKRRGSGVVPEHVRRHADVLTLVERTRQAGGRVVATGGCFDLLHRGHIDLLERARSLGDLLVVCLNSDASVRRAKGTQRPVVGQRDRARVLAALGAVDAVAIFDEDTPAQLLDWLRPDIWVKGSDYHDQAMPESAVVTGYGGRVVLLPMLGGYSTTRLVEAVRIAPVPA